MKNPLLFLGLAIGLTIGLVSGIFIERTAPVVIESPLPPVVVSTISTDINMDGQKDFAFYDGQNVLIAFSDSASGKFTLATIIGPPSFDEMSGDQELIMIANGEVSSLVVNNDNRAIADLACNTARPFQP